MIPLQGHQGRWSRYCHHEKSVFTPYISLGQPYRHLTPKFSAPTLPVSSYLRSSLTFLSRGHPFPTMLYPNICKYSLIATMNGESARGRVKSSTHRGPWPQRKGRKQLSCFHFLAGPPCWSHWTVPPSCSLTHSWKPKHNWKCRPVNGSPS